MNTNDNTDDDSSLGSSDAALLEMLGLCSLSQVAKIDDDGDEREECSANGQPSKAHSDIPELSDEWLESTLRPLAGHQYLKESVFQFPEECSVSAKHLRVMTEEVVWGSASINPTYPADRTYEGIKIWRDGEIEERKALTRLENFVDGHPGWSELCHNYLRRLVSAALGEEMVLFKEKLNLKPPGGR